MITREDAEAQNKLLKEFLSTNSVLIVDPVSSARVNLASSLTKLGAMRQKMSLVGTLEEARDEIRKLKPKFVFSDFMLGAESGLDLIQDQKTSYTRAELKETTFVLVTSNASQSTVARAAEEDVDTFIIKPYTLETLKTALGSVLQQKLNPSRYMELIELGKAQLIKSNYNDAVHYFGEAMKQHDQPTLACFYYGQTEFMRSALKAAEQKFNQGLGYNKIHFKCLMGLYELLMKQKKYHEAYDIVKRLSQYYPANPKRLAQVLRLAIITENFDDMEGYYRVYLKIPDRSENLTKYMCSALVVTGKHYLRKKIKSRAVELFEAAANSSGEKTNFLAYAIEALVDFKIVDEAEIFLKRLEVLDSDCADYVVSKFLVSTLSGDFKESIQMGTGLLDKGHESVVLYEKLISQAVKARSHDKAEAFFQTACKRWPERSNDFKYARESAAAES